MCQDFEVLNCNYRLYKCEYCEKEFVQAGNYRSHLRVSLNRINSSNKIKLVGFIKYLMNTYRLLITAFFSLQIHTKERPYKCSMCPKTYNQSSALKVHIRSHTNEKNYICSTCKKVRFGI